MTEAPAVPATDPSVPAGDAPPETPAPPATEPVEPPATPDAPAQDPATVADLGEGPDGDPVEGETPEQKLKRIARRADKERQAAERDRDAAVARATSAEAQLSEATTASEELTETKAQIGTLTDELGKANTRLWKYEVGASATPPLSLAQAERLMGTTREEIEADLPRLIQTYALPGAGDGSRGKPLDDAAARQRLVETARRRR